MAIRIWQPKWYKFWCDGVRWGYNPKNTYEDERNNSIKHTHRGYIIPRDATLEVKPSSAWYIFNSFVLISIISLMFILGICIYKSFGIIGIFITIGLIIILKQLFYCITELLFGCVPRRM